MLATRTSLAILAVLLSGTLPAVAALGRDKVTIRPGAAEIGTTADEGELPTEHGALETHLHDGMVSGMAGGYEGAGCGAYGMPGGYPAGGYPPGPGACGGPCDACGCGQACGCGNGYCYAPRDCCCCPPNYWYVDAGVYYLKPHWNTNPAFAVLDTQGVVDARSQTDFEYDGDVAPYVRAGYRTAFGLGIESRAWWYDDSENLAADVAAGNDIIIAAPLGLGPVQIGGPVTATFDASLQIDLVDLLLTYQMLFECGSLEFGAGARYARIEQSYNANVVNNEAIVSSHDFEGAGPSFSLEGRLLATPRLSFFATARYSLLFGSTHERAFLDNVVVVDVQAIPGKRSRSSDLRAGIWRRVYDSHRLLGTVHFGRVGITALARSR